MPSFDLLLAAVMLVAAYVVAGTGFFRSAVWLLAALFAGLAAMNFFEPLAERLEAVLPPDPLWRDSADAIALVGLFLGGVVLLRILAGRALRHDAPAHPLIEETGRWACGAATGYVAGAFLLATLHTVPLPREFPGFAPERKNLFGIVAPDRQWLGFAQYVSEHVFPRAIAVADAQGREVPAKRIFDGEPRIDDAGQVEYRSSFPMRYAHRRALRAGRIIPPDAAPADGENQ